MFSTHSLLLNHCLILLMELNSWFHLTKILGCTNNLTIRGWWSGLNMVVGYKFMTYITNDDKCQHLFSSLKSWVMKPSPPKLRGAKCFFLCCLTSASQGLGRPLILSKNSETDVVYEGLSDAGCLLFHCVRSNSFNKHKSNILSWV